MSSPNNIYLLINRTTNCRLYSNISQILLLYKVWVYYNKFDCGIIGGILPICQYVKMPQCGCVEHGLEYTTFYVAHFGGLFWSPLVRDGPLGAPTLVKLAYWPVRWWDGIIPGDIGHCHDVRVSLTCYMYITKPQWWGTNSYYCLEIVVL